jgi:hypothetical protein
MIRFFGDFRTLHSCAAEVAVAVVASLLPPGHDAWVVRNEPVVIDITGMATYAKPA